jgi:hypothetical protein
VGTGYRLTGSATDPEDGALPASSLSWTVVKVHDTHTHPFLGPIAGNDVAFTAPAPEDLTAATNSYLRITLTRNFQPRKVAVTLATSPAGRTVTANGQPLTGVSTVTAWAGYGISLGVPAQTDADGTLWGYSGWSDGGAQNHTFTTPASATTVTATLTARSPLGRSAWTASASASATGNAPARAVDGDEATRWATGAAQASGQWLQLDLGATQPVRHLVLNAGAESPSDYPRGYSVTVSTDGSTWSLPVATGTGSGQITRITFGSQTARYLRITQTGSATGWWGVAEVNAYS